MCEYVVASVRPSIRKSDLDECILIKFDISVFTKVLHSLPFWTKVIHYSVTKLDTFGNNGWRIVQPCYKSLWMERF
jgi:hypothetical protein